MSVLFRSENISRAADLKVTHRDLDPGSELCEFPDRLETLFRVLLQHLIALVHEERIGCPVRTPDPPADLVELGETQPHAVRILDDHRVRIRDIESRLDDRRGDEHVNVTVDEIQHDLLELVLIHLTMCECHICLRNKRRHMVCDLVNVVDTIVYIVHLPATS